MSGPAVLRAPTPAAWVEAAVEGWRVLLNDHANCEKKAASTALALMFTYPEDRRLGVALSRLASEGLRHFKQVQRLMEELDVPFIRQRPGRYASGLRSLVRPRERRRRIGRAVFRARRARGRARSRARHRAALSFGATDSRTDRRELGYLYEPGLT